MTNKEWLEQVKKFDEISEFRSDDSSNPYAFRQAKALEIIAEELIIIKEMFHRGIDLNVGIEEEKGNMIEKERQANGSLEPGSKGKGRV